MRRSYALSFVLSVLMLSSAALAQPATQVTWLWHLEQPIYWPAPNHSGQRYETAWDSLSRGGVHPENNLGEIFGKDDRVAVYQYRVHDSVQAMLGHADAGVQVSYSGGLIENVASLGANSAHGYGPGWANSFRTARGWDTSGGHPRVDIVQFPFHHALIPLIDAEVLRMELRLYRHAYEDVWGASDISRGLFPSEMAFAEHVIPVLEDEGIDWVIVSNSHISRACEDYPFQAGSGGDNIPPPNRADVQNPAQGTYNRISIDRGVAPANAVPYSYTPHWARWVDPDSGTESRVIVVPAAQSESWRDGYSCFSVGDIDALNPHRDDTRPMLVVLAHDGDNAFGGGFSYYHECTPNFANAATSNGHRVSTVEQYLADNEVPWNDVVHVESGAWVNADGDFGAPSFLNWNWPLVDATGAVDIEGGWAEDERNWAVITAATNVVQHATDLLGDPDIAEVYDPSGSADDVEIAWHFLLGSLNSGYMYYGMVLDMELKPTVACNEAVSRAEAAIGARTDDLTPPTVWLPQRYPDNPGGLNFGPLYGYRQETMGPEFYVWTFVHDVSGVDGVTLWVRPDDDGWNPNWDDANEVYAGGDGVGEWQSYAMTRRAFPKGDVYDIPDFNDATLPTVIADEYWVLVEDHSDVLVDYFIEAIDTEGNGARSPIQHVFIGDASGGGSIGGGGDPEGVHWAPPRPWRDVALTIFTPDSGFLHWGVDGWTTPPEAYWPADTAPFGDGLSVETPLLGPDEDGFYHLTIGPFDGVDVDVIDFVIHRSDDSWDNNGGGDYHITIAEEEPSSGGGGSDVGFPDRPDTGGGGGSDDAGLPPRPDAGGGADTGSGGGSDAGGGGGPDLGGSDAGSDSDVAGGGSGAGGPDGGTGPGGGGGATPANTEGCGGCRAAGADGLPDAVLGLFVAGLLVCRRRRDRHR